MQNGHRSARVDRHHCDSADEGGSGDRIERLALRIADHVRHSWIDVFNVGKSMEGKA